jgi:hypothetical protein
MIFEGAHPAIIEQETFDVVQRIRDGRRRQTKLGDMGVLNGRLYCEDCGSKLHIKRRSSGGKAQYVYYVCRQSRSNSDGFGNCTPHSIRKEVAERLVLSDIQRVFALAKDSEAHFVELVSRQSRRETEKSVRKAKAECAKAETRIRQLDDIIAQIYEDKVGGELSAERFAKMLEKYEREQAELNAKLDELRPMLERAEEETQNVERFMRLVRTYTEIEALTADVVNEFIERIEVGETVVVKPRRFSHWKDEKRQNIRIVYNYIGAVPQEDKAVETTTREKTITAT